MSENSNLKIYESVRAVPPNAKKEIAAGRLKGKTDINPMWRIKSLTETFGPCGIGWKYVITRQWTETGAGGEICAFCNIDLFVKYNGEWSEAIPGTGGSALVANEKNGPFTSDECFKMALTDAISVACKALGMGADVYWDADCTKYMNGNVNNNPTANNVPPVQQRTVQPQQMKPLTDSQLNRMYIKGRNAGYDEDAVRNLIVQSDGPSDPHNMTRAQYEQLCAWFDARKKGGTANA